MKPAARLTLFFTLAFVISWSSWFPALMWPSWPKPLALIGLFGPAIAATSGEEIGWRGFVLPELLGMGWQPVRASVLLGMVWGLWHPPLYLVPGQSSFRYPLFLALTVGQSLIYTTLYLRSGASLLPAFLLHAGTDFAPRLLHIDRFDTTAWLTFVALVWATGLVMLRFSESVPLVERGRLDP